MIKYERGFKGGRHNSASFLVHTVLDEAHVKCTSTLYKCFTSMSENTSVGTGIRSKCDLGMYQAGDSVIL